MKKRTLAVGVGLLVLAAVGAILVPRTRSIVTQGFASLTSDTIQLLDASEQPVVGTVIIGQGALATNCRVYSGDSKYPVGNLTGDSALAVVSPTTAVHYERHTQWTWRPLESHDLRLRRPIPLAVKIWQLSTIATTARADAIRAAAHLKAEASGLDMTYSIEDVTLLKKTVAGCSSLTQLRRTIHPVDSARNIFDPKAINVYYADGCGKDCIDAGRNCEGDDRQNVFVYTTGSESTLLHELGHALLGSPGQQHWKSTRLPMNVMRDSTAPDRRQFSTGQIINMNFEATSALAHLSLASTQVNCQSDCPAIEFDKSDQCPPPQSRPSILRAVQELFECVECDEGQLERVVNDARTDEGVITNLESALARPEPVRPQIVPGEPPPPPPVVDPYEANAIARRQRRSVKALELISVRYNSARARNILRDAFEFVNSYRSDVQQAIRVSFLAVQ